MKRREPTAVYLSEGDGVLVKHTQDVELAAQLARAEIAAQELPSSERTPEVVGAIQLGRPRVGWYRITHCLPSSWGAGEGYAWTYWPTTGPTRGAFPAVEFCR